MSSLGPPLALGGHWGCGLGSAEEAWEAAEVGELAVCGSWETKKELCRVGFLIENDLLLRGSG